MSQPKDRQQPTDTTTNPQQANGKISLAGGQAQSTGTTSGSKVETDAEREERLQREQAHKLASASNAAYTTGTFFNVRYAELDNDYNENNVPHIFKNGKGYRITCYIVPKFVLDNSKRFSTKMSESLALRLTYGSQVEGIVLVDRLDNIGLSGFVQVKSVQSYLDLFLERHNNFFFVINIAEQTSDGGEFTYYQPYIFDIAWIEQLSNPESQERKMRIHLIDCMTAVLKTHSIASVIRFNPNIVECINYKDVFKIILNYIKCYLKTNSNNTADFRKDLLYGPGVHLGGNKNNGYDNDASMNSLIKNSFGKISRNATILQALQQLLQDCVTTLKVPKKFSEGYESIGDLLIPFFFKEEYPDRYAVYPSFWLDEEAFGKVDNKKKKTDAKPQTQTTQTEPKPETTEQPVQSQPVDSGKPQETRAIMPIDQGSPAPGETGSVAQPTWLQEPAAVQALAAQGQAAGVSAAAASSNNDEDESSTESIQQGLVNYFQQMFYQDCIGKKVKMRQVTMRDFFMPFYLCFGANDDSTGEPPPHAVYQVFSPTQDADYRNILSMNGYYGRKPIYDLQFDPIDMSTVRKIWKNVVFIDCSTGGGKGNSTLIFFNWFYDYFKEVFLNNNQRGYISNVIPDFYTISRNTGAGNAEKQSDTFDCLFDEYNAYTYATQTDDTVNECLRHMGRNISSFVLLNDMYTFSVDGDIMRRPNEIIRMGMTKKNDGTANMLTAHTDLNYSEFLLMYVRQVTHKFVGNEYQNIMNCCKICEYNPSALKTKIKV